MKSSKLICILGFIAIQLITWPLIAIMWGLTEWRNPAALLQIPVNLGITIVYIIADVLFWRTLM